MPALCRAFSEAAGVAQRDHMRSHKRLLWTLVGIGLASAAGQGAPAISPEIVPAERIHDVEVGAAVVGTILFVLGLVFEQMQRAENKPELWYDARALAESAKSMAWKYMMRSDPYRWDDADALFCRDLYKLLSDAKQAPMAAGGDGDQITAAMRRVRALPFAERLVVYRRDRIGDQRNWYTRRSGQHKRSNDRWQGFVTALLVVALVLSVVSVLKTSVGALVGIATAIVPCAIAWNQTQRHRDLAHSYAFTSQEIGLLTEGREPKDDDQTHRFVADCETAFSREHTMWRARREITEA